MLELHYYNDPVLKKKTARVTVFDESLGKTIDEMIATMIEKDGVGLAAPQVGLSIKLAVIDATNGEKPPLVLVNPEVIEESDEVEENEEGCLSFPDLHLKITRPVMVTIKAQDATGKEFLIENATGLLARALQHEIDHINGFLIVDRISLLQRQMIKGKLNKLIQEHSENLQAV